MSYHDPLVVGNKEYEEIFGKTNIPRQCPSCYGAGLISDGSKRVLPCDMCIEHGYIKLEEKSSEL